MDPRIEKLLQHSKETRRLDLSNLTLTSVPEQLFEITNLVELHLNDNFLTFLPSNIRKLTNLKKLDLTNNRLTSLPPELGSLPLKELRVALNPFLDPKVNEKRRENLNSFLTYISDPNSANSQLSNSAFSPRLIDKSRSRYSLTLGTAPALLPNLDFSKLAPPSPKVREDDLVRVFHSELEKRNEELQFALKAKNDLIEKLQDASEAQMKTIRQLSEEMRRLSINTKGLRDASELETAWKKSSANALKEWEREKERERETLARAPTTPKTPKSSITAALSGPSSIKSASSPSPSGTGHLSVLPPFTSSLLSISLQQQQQQMTVQQTGTVSSHSLPSLYSFSSFSSSSSFVPAASPSAIPSSWTMSHHVAGPLHHPTFTVMGASKSSSTSSLSSTSPPPSTAIGLEQAQASWAAVEEQLQRTSEELRMRNSQLVRLMELIKEKEGEQRTLFNDLERQKEEKEKVREEMSVQEEKLVTTAERWREKYKKRKKKYKKLEREYFLAVERKTTRLSINLKPQ